MAKSRSSGSLLCTENANGWRTIMDVKDFYYDLPQELIAQDPLEDRSSSRLMVLDKITGEVEHRHFKDITEYLRPGDCLVLNNTKVIPARLFGVKEGTMAIAGLNPHSGEHGLFGWEEVEEIMPAIEELKAEGYDVAGPIGADSVFHQAAQGKYTSVLSLYHDQGHIATKTLDFEKTIAITNGMPILRTSVDHGTAFDIAGKGIVSAVSMIEAIRLAAKYAPNFTGKHEK